MNGCTQTDIALALGVSQATVGLVVGNSSSARRQRLSEKTVRRIREKAREMGYKPHRAAQILRTGKSNTITLLNFGGYTEIGARRAYEIGRMVHEAGYDFNVVDAYWWAAEAGQVLEQILSVRPLGVIMAGYPQMDFPLGKLPRAGIALAAIGTHIQGVSCARYDARAAIREITAAMITSGRRRLAMVVRNFEEGMTWQLRERVEGFKEAIAACGGETRECRGAADDFGFSRHSSNVEGVIAASSLQRMPFHDFEPSMEVAQRLMAGDVRPDMLVCTNDFFAVGAATVCNREGIDVPEEVGISGFDNVSLSTQGSVPLTTVEQPTTEMCAAAMEILRSKIHKKTSAHTPPIEHVFPCRVVWRESAPKPCFSKQTTTVSS